MRRGLLRYLGTWEAVFVTVGATFPGRRSSVGNTVSATQVAAVVEHRMGLSDGAAVGGAEPVDVQVGCHDLFIFQARGVGGEVATGKGVLGDEQAAVI